jgi:hypothetical protein
VELPPQRGCTSVSLARPRGSWTPGSGCALQLKPGISKRLSLEAKLGLWDPFLVLKAKLSLPLDGQLERRVPWAHSFWFVRSSGRSAVPQIDFANSQATLSYARQSD